MKLGAMWHMGVRRLLLLTLSLLILAMLWENLACVPFHIPGTKSKPNMAFSENLAFLIPWTK